MILLQLSSGQGPAECCLAVGHALKYLSKQCHDSGINIDIIEQMPTGNKGEFKSVTVQLSAKSTGNALTFAKSWQGSILWICPSPYRPRHKRKNWFISGHVFNLEQTELTHHITFQSCKSSGAGGQHVNTTNSAIRATHTATGITVRVDSERSQHANKRLATALIFKKLNEEKQQRDKHDDQTRWQQHWELERGNPIKAFKGKEFKFIE